MSSSDIPEFEKSIYIYEDKPVILTMISGGFFISIFLYFIFSRVVKSFSFPGSSIIPLAMAIMVLIISVLGARGFDVQIKINTKSGWIRATSKTQFWEGYPNDLKSLIVLQRERSMDNDTSYIEYKLYLEIDDGSHYEVPLITNLALEAMEVIEKAKSIIPIKHN
ncbi:MAG: hypothetical protein HeimC2_06740 [Candidatus Heimdallarchaeota archaeon LC_2]|nr:MAG: hypothetical protein HeimC2_06740 [Candidatus Heimdallarchaeota archaeon LC_2]